MLSGDGVLRNVRSLLLARNAGRLAKPTLELANSLVLVNGGMDSFPTFGNGVDAGIGDGGGMLKGASCESVRSYWWGELSQESSEEESDKSCELTEVDRELGAI